jgi:hypothetical protein
MTDEIRDVVTWESIVGKDFMETFKQVAIAEYWAGVKDLPINTVYGRFSDADIDLYHEKRRVMLHHGWRQSYLVGRDKKTLKFMVVYDPKTSRYITLYEYISKRQAEHLAAYADEWDANQERIIKQTTRDIGKKAYHVRQDEVFVTEESYEMPPLRQDR